jgi:hypothetical protein
MSCFRLLVVSALVLGVAASPNGRVPPRGWNSWDCFQGNLNETGALAVAENMVKFLLPAGYDVLTIDEFWYPNNCEGGHKDNSTCVDEYGRPQPDVKKWPSSAGGKGFKAFSDKIHAMGLRLGIHTLRGSVSAAAIFADSKVKGTTSTIADIVVPASEGGQCNWNKDWFSVNASNPASAAFIDSVYQQYADWGIDFIKNDCIGVTTSKGHPHNYVPSNIALVSAAIKKSGRPMTYSLSPGGGDRSLNGTDEVPLAATVANITNLYRITDDWHGGDMQYHYAVAHAMEPFIGVVGLGGDLSFPDLDMLNPYTNAKDDLDFKLQMTLWAMARSPLMYGADIRDPSLTAADFALMTNPRVLAVQVNSIKNKQVYSEGGVVVWGAMGSEPTSFDASSATGPTAYVALMNYNKHDVNASVTFTQLAMDTAVSSCVVTDLWTGESLGSMGPAVTARLAAGNGAALYSLSSCK